jgi:EmrB/QacA subfamily drug resistance transporter
MSTALPTEPTLASPTPSANRARDPRLILALVCAAQFVVILDLAIVNVALPSIQQDLGVSASSLQWIVIAYGLTLGGFLLLGGRTADLFGRRAVLAAGLGVFAAASLAGGLADSLGVLIGARAVQGVGGALALPAALSIVTSTFPEGSARNQALGIFGAVGGSAASIGVIAGGLLTSGPGWEWVFLINVPVGVVFAGLVFALVPSSARPPHSSIDVAGAVTVTAGLMAVVYAINKSVDDGWTSATVLGFLGAGLVLLAAFVAVESRATDPLLPLRMFRHRTLSAAIVVSTLANAAFFATIFEGTLFMQKVLHYSAIETGVAWLAATCSALVMAGGIAPVLVGRIRPGASLAIGQLVMGAGLLVLTQTPSDAAYWPHLFPGFLTMGLGMGLSLVALQVAAFTGVDDAVSGLAGGMIETSREVGGAIGVAVVATLAIARADDVLAERGTDAASTAAALTAGYQRASLVAALLAIAAGVAAAAVLRRAERGGATSGSPNGPNMDSPGNSVIRRNAVADVDSTTIANA